MQILADLLGTMLSKVIRESQWDRKILSAQQNGNDH